MARIAASGKGSPAVIGVLLPSKGLEGHISRSFGTLTGLEHLDLSNNSLSGGLPLELLSSSSIAILDVSFNKLDGTFHELPSSTPARPLQVLNISSNLFAGQFPSTTWKSMENMVTLNAISNSFTGQIPTQLCNISPFLTVLDMCFNKFSGGIPPGLGDCSKLREFRAGHNNLRAMFPDELFNVTSLEYLSLVNNGLDGVLDTANKVNLRNIVTLDLGGNRFSGKIPDYIGQFKRLEEFHLNNNMMSGELPSALSNCTNLITIDLKSNYFSGELTKILKSSKKLAMLFIGHNFRGEILTQDGTIDGFGNLQVLDMQGCYFSGRIPVWISRAANLEMLTLSNNYLTGPIPGWISSLSQKKGEKKRNRKRRPEGIWRGGAGVDAGGEGEECAGLAVSAVERAVERPELEHRYEGPAGGGVGEADEDGGGQGQDDGLPGEPAPKDPILGVTEAFLADPMAGRGPPRRVRPEVEEVAGGDVVAGC
ncbi:Tyrosine-sulfated glycopeptide receptor 1 [Hordeum vulgare]|nr:Tyrosine-sulfated glycopeptide receptor 1 [Hordeum vulgare]